MLVYEDRSMAAVVEAAERVGARVVAEGSVDMDELDAVLDDSELASTKG